VRYAGGIVPSTLLPRIPGRDFAGVIVEGPAELFGREVYGSGGDLGISRNGTHAQYIELPITAVASKPKTLSMAEAASVGVPYVTAYKALIELALIAEDETVLILGGSGAVGTAAAQLAKWRGAIVISTTRRSDLGTNWRLYTDDIINMPDDDIVESVMTWTNNRGVDVVLNAIGGSVFEQGLKSLAPSGRMVCITAAGQREVSIDLMHFYKHQLTLFGLDTLEFNAIECAEVLELLAPGFEAGYLGVEVAKILPLDNASEAYQLVAKGGVGKVVLSMLDVAN
jgi:NADPH2:quinone reductase